MRNRIVLTICLTFVSIASHGLEDPCCESSPPWTICGAGSFAMSAPCSPGSPSCGTYAFYYANGSGALNESGIYQCGVVSYLGTVYAHYDMGLYTPYGGPGGAGGGSVFQLRVAPSPVSCGALCGAGELLYSSNTHNCGAWNFTGPFYYELPAPGTYCIIAVACGNDGWSCGGAIAIDHLSFFEGDPYPGVDDWVLY